MNTNHTGLDAELMNFIDFQTVVGRWMNKCFGGLLDASKKSVRNFRFFEEAAELVQVGGMTREQAHELVDYVYNRPVGVMAQEVGGVMVTLAALCATNGIELGYAAYEEVERIHQPEVLEKIRAKQASKVGDGPLPGVAPSPSRVIYTLSEQLAYAPPKRTVLVRGDKYQFGDKVGVLIASHPHDGAYLILEGWNDEADEAYYFTAERDDLVKVPS